MLRNELFYLSQDTFGVKAICCLETRNKYYDFLNICLYVRTTNRNEDLQIKNKLSKSIFYNIIKGIWLVPIRLYVIVLDLHVAY